jgi:hypothetical protein
VPTSILRSVSGRILRIQEIRPIAFVYGPGLRSPADLSVCPAGITLQVKRAHPQDRAICPLKVSPITSDFIVARFEVRFDGTSPDEMAA